MSSGETANAARSLGFNVSDAEVSEKGVVAATIVTTAADSFAPAASGSTDLNGFITVAQTFAARGNEDDSSLYEAFRCAMLSVGDSLRCTDCAFPLFSTFDKLGNGSVPAKEFAQYSAILGDTFTQVWMAICVIQSCRT